MFIDLARRGLLIAYFTNNQFNNVFKKEFTVFSFKYS